MKKIKQSYHLEAPRGLLNDPNGLTYFKGKYYIFFQWNRFAKNHSYKEWGLFTSVDLLNYEFQGSAIIPSQDYDIDGVFSGSGCVINDALCLYYTGNCEKNGKNISSQCLAVTKDGKRFKKKGIIIPAPREYTGHFRDPKIFTGKNGDYYMVIGGQQRENLKGAVILYHSENGRTWHFKNTLAVSCQYEMVECPDLFELGGRSILLYNLQHRDNTKDIPLVSFSVYKTGHFDEKTASFSETDLDNDYILMDRGFDFFAPQTFLAPDGRRILFAWMSRMNDMQEAIFAQYAPNIHCLTLPRELYLNENTLCQRPVKELYRLLGDEIPVDKYKNDWQARPPQRAFFMLLKNIHAAQNSEIIFHNGEIILNYDYRQKKLSLTRKNWETSLPETKSATVSNLKEIEIWSDYSSMEIFVNKGQIVFSSRILPENTPPEITIKNPAEKLQIQINNILNPKIEYIP